MKQGDITIQDEAVVSPLPVIKSVTKDLAVTGSVQYIGIGFRPSYVFFNAFVSSVNGCNCMGWTNGTAAGTNQKTMSGDSYNSQPDRYSNESQSIVLSPAASNQAHGILTSFDVDGFTLNWIHAVGSPTGTANIHFICFK